jgi:valyl-tRNA synthetase
MGVFDTGEIPFREVSIHPKILDRYGETMSKSKGNGVDPVDVIEALGADALRFALAGMATETQDVRMPVDFQCPACGHLVEQTTQNRTKPRVECSKCGKPFRTQWAASEADLALPRGPAVSEKFEAGRNFSNKLWNATRFVLMGLDGDAPVGPITADLVAGADLADRWLASRLASVAREATKAIDEYRYAELARILYGFAWDEYCSAYLELCKPRLADPAGRDRARAMLLVGLDTILRLLHPIMPFVTEEIWQQLRSVAGGRRMPWDDPGPLPESLMTARWPDPPGHWVDERTERQFGTFLAVVGAIRELRARQNVPPRTRVPAAIRAAADVAELLEPMRAAIEAMATVELTAVGPAAAGPAGATTAAAAGCDVFVDLADLVDVDAEIARLEKDNAKTEGLIAAKQAKLANETFTARAPEAVVAGERAQLAELEERLVKGVATLAALRSRKGNAGG